MASAQNCASLLKPIATLHDAAELAALRPEAPRPSETATLDAAHTTALSRDEPSVHTASSLFLP